MKSISKLVDIKLDIKLLTSQEGDLAILGSRCGGIKARL